MASDVLAKGTDELSFIYNKIETYWSEITKPIFSIVFRMESKVSILHRNFCKSKFKTIEFYLENYPDHL